MADTPRVPLILTAVTSGYLYEQLKKQGFMVSLGYHTDMTDVEVRFDAGDYQYQFIAHTREAELWMLLNAPSTP